MSNASIAAYVYQALDVHLDFGAQRSFDLEILIDDVANPLDLLVGKLVRPEIGTNAGSREYLIGRNPTYPIDIGERDLYTFVARQVNACNTSH